MFMNYYNYDCILRLDILGLYIANQLDGKFPEGEKKMTMTFPSRRVCFSVNVGY